MTTEIFGYARISTSKQDLQLQRDALEQFGCTQIIEEVVGGAKRERPALNDLLGKLRKNDKVVVWRMDRLARSLKDLIDITAHIESAGAEFISLNENLDTSSAGGRLIFNVMASIGQFERELLIERTRAGLTAARKRGRIGGRPRKLDDKDIEQIRILMSHEDRDIRSLCQRYAISRSTLYRVAQSPPD